MNMSTKQCSRCLAHRGVTRPFEAVSVLGVSGLTPFMIKVDEGAESETGSLHTGTDIKHNVSPRRASLPRASSSRLLVFGDEHVDPLQGGGV